MTQTMVILKTKNIWGKVIVTPTNYSLYATIIVSQMWVSKRELES